ncbi:hypothetical protein EV356DRAFT_511927 [Viridothelium virens]|uniref:Xylanolytic transcriptional activator regulatory domain-containing protein n=1 Tax=Viridothelium virens TaxID=1048519 RepID=A0A6A6HH43_VIRVR|nr:hypothetical protein EV356DRAFT_511927 [Viridothelium virens]
MSMDNNEVSMEDNELEPENDIEPTGSEDQDQTNSSVSGSHDHANNENLYMDTQALDALSQAAGIATSEFRQSNLELRQAPQDSTATHYAQGQAMAPGFNRLPSTYASASGQLSPPSSNIAQNVTDNWSAYNANFSPMDTMDYDIPWDQVADIGEWTTLDFNYPDSLQIPSTGFDMFSYNTQIPTWSPNAGYVQLDGPHWPTDKYDTLSGQTLNSGPVLPRISADFGQSSLQSQALSSSESFNTPIATPQSGPQSLPPSRHTQNNTSSNVALDDARQEQMLKNSGPWPTHWNPSKPDNLMGFPNMDQTPPDVFEAENFAHVESLSQKVYDDISRCFTTVSSNQSLFKKFRDSNLPPLAAFDCFIQLYFEYFQPMYPLLHQPTFNPSQAHFVLILAIVSIGCRYSRSKEARKCAIPLSELTRRALLQTIEMDNSNARKTWYTQAQLLNNLSMLYSGDKRFLEVAQADWGALIVQTRRNNSLKEPVRPINPDLEPLSGAELDAKWIQWRNEEARTRLAYVVWALDSQLCMFFDIHSSMDIIEVQRKLPIREDVWEAATAEAWRPLYLKYQFQIPDIHTALSDLKSRRGISSAVGDLARIQVGQAIFATIWEARRAFKNPLIQHLSPVAEPRRRWQLQDEWRCMLETLAAHPLVAEESSPMASTVRNQTHHITLLIYAPLTELLAFAGAEVYSSDKKEVIHQKLLAWLHDDDGRVARRAVLHAAIVFTFVRSATGGIGAAANKKSNFFEPFALLISTLTLWVYVQLQPTLDAPGQTRIRRRSTAGGAAGVDRVGEEKQRTVRLDRAKEEAVVRLWVEEGADLRGHISDVGNITGPGAGQRLLSVACRTLVGMEAWPLSQGFAKVLSILGGKSTPGEKQG